ncbi:E3 ubiquitin-protein ligase [Canna indica]|uniref:RING-type E3 ubiquitin transferase n=1 Tax=Canna indica TaxID=4628 RepID=A0AAQ3KSR9_9LILI|nr:E3 ubiquitin-protein ligase [Canna indica]
MATFKGGDGVFLSPGFRSAAAMAGWDEEALLHAALVVEDTPVRESRQHKQKRPRPLFKTPPSTNSSTRKRRSRRHPAASILPVVLQLDDDEEEQPAAKDLVAEKVNKETATIMVDEAKVTEKEGSLEEKESSKRVPCMDRLREELSCAICLDICFEPSTTPCGHSFCIKCLKRAADKCGKRCPKCRQLISNGRSCTVNTVLWNTIQLLFPDEVEVRKNKAGAPSPGCETRNRSSERRNNNTNINISRNQTRYGLRRVRTQVSQATEQDRSFRRRPSPSQSEDAALALRLQREEFMVAFQGTP